MKNLLEAGVHFGHQAKRWNPKMSPFIYSERNGVHIIDLQKTVERGEVAYNFVRDSVMEGAKILFVGTKKQAQESLIEEAERCNSFYIAHRWVGGMLTNFTTIKKNILRLKKLEKMEVDGTFESLTKKECSRLWKEKDRLDYFLGGIKEMSRLPDLVFIVDIVREYIAVQEARKLEIPIVAILDSNCDPYLVDYPIPGNDDAIRAIHLFSKVISDAVIEGETLRGKKLAESLSEKSEKIESSSEDESSEDHELVQVEEKLNKEEPIKETFDESIKESKEAVKEAVEKAKMSSTEDPVQKHQENETDKVDKEDSIQKEPSEPIESQAEGHKENHESEK